MKAEKQAMISKHTIRGRSKSFVLFLLILGFVASSVLAYATLVMPAPQASAANNAVNFCMGLIKAEGGSEADTKKKGTAAYNLYNDCAYAYNMMYRSYDDVAYNNICSGKAKDINLGRTIGSNGFCEQGRDQGRDDYKKDRPTPGGNRSPISNEQIVKIAQANAKCQIGTDSNPKRDACVAGYVNGYKQHARTGGVAESAICKNGGAMTVGGKTYRVTNSTIGNCKDGWDAGQRDEEAGVTVPSTGNTTPPPSNQNRDEAEEEEEEGNSCEAKFDGRVSWAICPIVEGTNSAIDFLDSGINSMLVSDTNRIFGNKDQEGTSGHAYYQAWDNFRKFALGVIFIVALIILIATAFGFEILDAYTIRKTLPRALLAIILITLSWSIMNFLINFTNDIGNGIRWVIYAPFERLDGVSFDLGASILSGVVLSAGGIALGIIGLLSFAVTALIGVVIAFGILIIRELGLQFLTVVFPIAIALMILPNTQKVWNMAKSALISLLVAFPIITGVIAAGRVFSQTIYANGNAQPHEQIIALFAYILPYFLLLNILAMVGGVTAMMSNVAQRQSAGMMKGLQAYRGNKMKGNLHAMKEGNRFKASNPVASRFNRFTKGVANVPNAGITPWKMKDRYRAGMSQHSMAARAEYMEKSNAWKAIQGNDDYLQATMKNMGGGDTEDDWRRYLHNQGYTGRDVEQGVALIRAAKRDTNDHVFKTAAVLANFSTGTGWKEGGAGQAYESINEAVGDDRDEAARILAEGRSRAGQAGRLDLSGAGFGSAMGDINALHRGATTADQVTKLNNERAMYLKGPGELARARGDSIKLMAPAMRDRIVKAKQERDRVARLDPTGTSDAYVKAERTLAQEYATAAGIHDTLAHTAPENARIFADVLMNYGIEKDAQGNTQRTIQDEIDAYRLTNNEAFSQTRKDLELPRAGGGISAAAAAAEDAATRNDVAPPDPGP